MKWTGALMALVGSIMVFASDTFNQFYVGVAVIAAGVVAWLIGAAEGEK